MAITLFPTSAYLDAELRRRFDLVYFHELAHAEADRWLAANGDRVVAAITNGKVGCDGALVAALPSLKIVAIHGVGFDQVDLPSVRGRGIIVTNTPDVLTDDVADLAVGLVISLLRRIPMADRFVRDGLWNRSEYPLQVRVTGKRFGIVGLGRIGQAIAARLHGFGPVSYTGTHAKPVPWSFHENVVSLASACDVLIVACAANDATRSLIGCEALSALGAEGYLVNIARGSVVDEGALAEAFASGTIAGAALDVFSQEPLVQSRLLASDRLVLTPHIGSATRETRLAMAESVIANLDAFLARAPVPNPVS